MMICLQFLLTSKKHEKTWRPLRLEPATAGGREKIKSYHILKVIHIRLIL
jgi:hypothetical protein